MSPARSAVEGECTHYPLHLDGFPRAEGQTEVLGMLTSHHASTSGYATVSEVESFLRVKEDKRRELLRSCG